MLEELIDGKMTTLKETKEKMLADPRWWKLYFYDFVDEFRRNRDFEMIAEPFELTGDKMEALLASTVERLCDEIGIMAPDWVNTVPGCKEPFFVSGVENLKAISIVQSPLKFRARNIFVMENFLSRV